MNVSRKLIKDDDLCETTLGACAPCVEFTGPGGHEGAAKPIANQRIQCRINPPPLRGLQLIEPEQEDLLKHGALPATRTMVKSQRVAVSAMSTSAGIPKLRFSLRIIAKVSGRLRLRTS